jgi:hypothetical protein
MRLSIKQQHYLIYKGVHIAQNEHPKIWVHQRGAQCKRVTNQQRKQTIWSLQDSNHSDKKFQGIGEGIAS